MLLHTDDDAAAIHRCRSGDIRGLDALMMARHQVQALRVAYLLTGDRMQAEDVVQDSFLQVFRTIAGTSPRHLHLGRLDARRVNTPERGDLTSPRSPLRSCDYNGVCRLAM